ncbi:hypothetical protein [Frigoriglobus tundricola]|uniref:Glycosyltransferase RgtA/B/C/D-like domain-containing protein n=1 Tax=Frigoriglobus tundricola TaxID=2774151 RepID=A0A6M5YTE7_9BACT|nr:hypothetical protein [Frigoriglobus tundricola]QJW96714.1 hypothetical protein FTUN_4273 [Frigoriglobus tundricola]
MTNARRLAPWIALWVLILGPRVWVLTHQPVLTEPRGEVERSAACLAANGFLGNPYYGHGEPSAHVAPLYPTLLAGIYLVLGAGYAGHLCQGVVTIALTGTAISLLPRLSRFVNGRSGPGWGAAVLMSVLPFNLGFIQVWGMWEQHGSFLAVALYLPLLIAAHRDQWQSPRRAAALGAATGCVVLLNPPFGLAFGLFVLAEVIGQRERWRLVRRVALTGAVAALVVCPWALRNYYVLGGFCPVRSNAGLELAIGNNDQSNGKTYSTYGGDSTPSPIDSIHPYTNPERLSALKQRGELEFMKDRQQEAVAWIRANPERWADLTLRRAYLFWLPPADMWAPTKLSDFQRQVRSWIYRATSVLMVIGLVGLLRADWGAFAATAAVLLGLSASYYVTHVDVRYAFPLHGLALVLGCRPLVAVAERVGGYRP